MSLRRCHWGSERSGTKGEGMDSFTEIADLVSEETVPPIGQLLLEGGFIILQDLEFALEHQKYGKGALGDILVRIGALEQEDLEKVLSIQFAGKRS